MFEIFKKEIKTSICAPKKVIAASDISDKIAKDIDYVEAETVATFDNATDAFRTFATMKNNVTFLPRIMRGYEEISVTIFFLYDSGSYENVGSGNDETWFSVGDNYYMAQFSENVYFCS